MLLEPVGEHEKTDFSKLVGGVGTGGRNHSAASILGGLLRYQPTHQWNELVWPLLVAWNKTNRPPLDQRELEQTFNSIANAELKRRGAVTNL